MPAKMSLIEGNRGGRRGRIRRRLGRMLTGGDDGPEDRANVDDGADVEGQVNRLGDAALRRGAGGEAEMRQ